MHEKENKDMVRRNKKKRIILFLRTIGSGWTEGIKMKSNDKNTLGKASLVLGEAAPGYKKTSPQRSPSIIDWQKNLHKNSNY